jgi:hypothetical protein
LKNDPAKTAALLATDGLVWIKDRAVADQQ